jgi:polysaccharide biosynthesis transport protein
VDLRRLIAVIRAWLPFLVVSVVLAAGVALVVSSALPKVYEAKATLIVGQSLSAVNTDYSQLLVSQRLSTTYASVATKRPFLDSVIAELDLDATSDELSRRVHADAPLESTLLTIFAQDSDPKRAAAIANALAAHLISASPAIQGRQIEFQASIDADLKATQEQIDTTQARVETLTELTERTAAQEGELVTLQGRLVSLRSTYATLLTFSSSNASNLLSVVEPAVAPDSPVSPRPLLNTVLAALLGLMVAVGVMIVWVHLDDAIRDPDQVREVAGLSTLGVISRMKGDKAQSEMYRLATLLYPQSSNAEAYRTLRSNIEFASVGAPIRTLLVTSAVGGEGKTVTASNLAVVFAQAGRRVLLVDADLRKPGVHSMFNLANAHGLTTLLRSDDVSLDAIAQVTEQDNLRVLTTGPLPPNPAELLGSPRMQAILETLMAGGDLVIFDSPPLQAVTDAAILSSFLETTILVIDAGRGRRRAVRLGSETLARAGASVLGAVLNRIPVRANAEADYYGTYYRSEDGTGTGPRETDTSPGRSAP